MRAGRGKSRISSGKQGFVVVAMIVGDFCNVFFKKNQKTEHHISIRNLCSKPLCSSYSWMLLLYDGKICCGCVFAGTTPNQTNHIAEYPAQKPMSSCIDDGSKCFSKRYVVIKAGRRNASTRTCVVNILICHL